jgi:iron complex transport system substrate-binding protein
VNRNSRFIPLLVGLCLSCCASPEPRAKVAALAASDDLGRTVSLSSPPARIVSLAPSITETLFALGLDSLVVGVTDYCNYPPAAARLPRVGGMLNPAIEEIVSLRPDLVLMSGSGNMQSDFRRLTTLGMTVFVSYPRNLEGVFKSIDDIGHLTGRGPQADSLVRGLRAEAARIQHRASQNRRNSVLVLVSVRPLISVGGGTFLDELIRLCNATNIASQSATAYPMISREEILSADPDRIIVTSDAVKDRSELFHAFAEWHHLRAIADSAVAVVDADKLTRPGPRIVEGLRELYRAVHGQVPEF